MRVLTSIVLCLTAFATAPVMALDANEQAEIDAPPATFRVYSVTWQPTYCQMQKDRGKQQCETVPAQFKTHGIWPYSESVDEYTNRHPQFCTPSAACQAEGACDIGNLSAVVGSVEQLQNWLPENPINMLTHEWKKHGTCSGKSMQAYFQDFVDLRNTVVTVDENSLAFQALIDRSTQFKQIRKLFPANTAFRCYQDDAGKQYLHEVFYLIDEHGQPYLQESNLQIGVQCSEMKETLISSKVQ